jgi:GT2 family glycosyltransferase
MIQKDGSLEMVKKEFPEVKTVKNIKNLGFAGGNNSAKKTL